MAGIDATRPLAPLDSLSGDRRCLVRLLSDAFRDEPAQAWLFPNRRVRVVASRLWFHAMLRAAETRGQVWCLSDRSAVAVWFPPGTVEELEGPAAVALRLVLALLPGARRRTAALEATLEAWRSSGEHWHLAAVATDVRKRGAGRGRLVLEPMLREIECSGGTAVLETSEPRSVPFYVRLGFGVCRSFRPDGGPEIWAMAKERGTAA